MFLEFEISLIKFDGRNKQIKCLKVTCMFGTEQVGKQFTEWAVSNIFMQKKIGKKLNWAQA